MFSTIVYGQFTNYLCCALIDTINLLNLTGALPSIGNGVTVELHPTVGPVYMLSKSFSVTTETSAGWSVIREYANEKLSWYVHMSSNYVGNLIHWNQLLSINIHDDNSKQVLILMLSEKNVFRVNLPNATTDFRRLGFTLRGCSYLSVYVDCSLLQSFEVNLQLLDLSNSREFTIFENIDSRNDTVLVRNSTI